MSIKQAEELFERMVCDMYCTEKSLLRLLPKMARAAQSDRLIKALEDHLEETEHHLTRIEDIMEEYGCAQNDRPCETLKGLATDMDDLIYEVPKGKLRDIGLAALARKFEHYEIAGYGALCEFAHAAGYKSAWKTLDKTLKEEQKADNILARVTARALREKDVTKKAADAKKAAKKAA